MADDQTIAHFHERGWMRIPQAFSPENAAAMRDAVWRALADIGIHRGDPSTWTVERPVRLQHLKSDPVFRAVRSDRVMTAIDTILDGAYPRTNWNAFFIAFPCNEAWGIPAEGWHIDAQYTGALLPPDGVQMHALFGDVPSRGGATQIVAGSHRLIHRWFKENPPPSGARGPDMRKFLQKHSYIRDLHTASDGDARIARFMNRVEEIDGISLQVVENTGTAGDVLLLHPLVLHVAAPNTGTQPRFLLSGGVIRDM